MFNAMYLTLNQLNTIKTKYWNCLPEIDRRQT